MVELNVGVVECWGDFWEIGSLKVFSFFLFETRLFFSHFFFKNIYMYICIFI